MCGGRGMDDEGFHIGHIGEEGEDFQRVNELEGFVLAALDLEGEDGTAAVREVLLVRRVVGMVRQGRVIDLGHLRVLGQEVHDFQCVGHVPLDPQGERFQALQEDEAAHRGERGASVPEQDGAGAGDVGGGADGIGKDNPMVAVLRLGELRELAGRLPVEFPGIHDDAADGGAVTADELRGGMDHDVRAQLDGPEQEWRREGIVHHERNPVPMGDGRNLLDVNDVAVGIAEGLDEQEFRLRTDGFLEVIQVGRVHEGGRDAVGDERVLQEVVGAAVDGLGRYDMVACTSDVQDCVGDGGGAGGDGQRAHAAFQRGDALLQDVLGGVRQAAVNVAGIRQAETRGGVRAVMEDVGRSLVNRNRAGVGSGIGVLLTHVELKGFKVEFLRCHISCVFLLAKLLRLAFSNKKLGKIGVFH